MINTNGRTDRIDGCFTIKTIEALKPILKSLEVIDKTCTSRQELQVIIEATLKIVHYVVNGVVCHLQNMKTNDEQSALFKGLMEIDLMTCRFVRTAMTKSMINGCPIDQVEKPAKKIDEEIEVLELFLETYKNMEKI